MEHKRAYTKPTARVIQLDSSPLLQQVSQEKTTKKEFIDDTEWEWDDNGAQ